MRKLSRALAGALPGLLCGTKAEEAVQPCSQSCSQASADGTCGGHLTTAGLISFSPLRNHTETPSSGRRLLVAGGYQRRLHLMHSSEFMKSLKTASVFFRLWQTHSPTWRWLLVGYLVERRLLGVLPCTPLGLFGHCTLVTCLMPKTL